MKCLFCGADLIWDSDVMASEIYDEYEDDDIALVSFFHCSMCGRNYEITDPTKEERKNYFNKFWI